MGIAMAIPPPPRIPSEPIPFHVDGIIEIQRSAQLWARLAVLASVLTGGVFLFLAWNGRVPWLLAIPFFLAPLLPIAAQNRIEELGRKTEEQVRDVGLRRVADEDSR